MVQRIELTPETISVWKDDELEWSAGTQQVAQGLFGQVKFPAGLLPPAVRWVGLGGRVWIAERPPEPKSFGFDNRIYHLTLPWQVLWTDMTTGEIRVFARPLPLSGLEDMLFQMPLPGINDSGRLPIASPPSRHAADTTLQQAWKQFHSLYLMGDIKPERLPPELQAGATSKVLERWASAGAGELLAVTRWGWIPRITLQDLIKESEGHRPATLGEVFEEAVRHR